MKTIVVFACIVSIAFCSAEKEKEYNYTGSTPAGTVVKSFLGIPLSDSVDFIRWKLQLRENQYELYCNYGIGKPNTSGFINGGKRVSIHGVIRKEQNRFQLQNQDKTLAIAELNNNLLHLLDANNNLLIGNAGWSYTLNSTHPVATDKINLMAKQSLLKDSIAFQGRTPCGVPGIIRDGIDCYKLKWHVVLYANDGINKTGKYKVVGTPWRIEGSKTGNWEINTGKDGRVIYRLKDDKGNSFLHLLKLDEHMLVFTDNQGKLLIGNEDFSYTLNREF